MLFRSWLGYDFLEKHPGGARVAAPSYMVDVYRECDVVEEILRIYGYNNIPLPHHMKMSVGATPKPDPEAVRNAVSNFLAAGGFVEIMNNSLTKAEYYAGLQTFPAERCATIVNPLSQDLNVMRQTLILGGLEVIAYNLNRQISSMRTFEYGSVYSRRPETSPETLEGYEEHTCFTQMLTGTPEKPGAKSPARATTSSSRAMWSCFCAATAPTSSSCGRLRPPRTSSPRGWSTRCPARAASW